MRQTIENQIVVRSPDNPVSLAPPQVKSASMYIWNSVSLQNISVCL